MNMLTRLHRKAANLEGGYALIELLIVIVILGILARDRGLLGQRAQHQRNQIGLLYDRKEVDTALEAYYAQSGAGVPNRRRGTSARLPASGRQLHHHVRSLRLTFRRPVRPVHHHADDTRVGDRARAERDRHPGGRRDLPVVGTKPRISFAATLRNQHLQR